MKGRLNTTLRERFKRWFLTSGMAFLNVLITKRAVAEEKLFYWYSKCNSNQNLSDFIVASCYRNLDLFFAKNIGKIKNKKKKLKLRIQSWTIFYEILLRWNWAV